jgi:hypothetical protein
MLSWSACWADLIWRPDADESGIVEPREYEAKTFPGRLPCLTYSLPQRKTRPL